MHHGFRGGDRALPGVAKHLVNDVGLLLNVLHIFLGTVNGNRILVFNDPL